MSSAQFDALYTGRSLVSFFPCGCWGAVQSQPRDLRERATETARFMRDADRDGATRVEEMTHEEWKALRNGVNGDLKYGCDHEPRWGGTVTTHDECPRCWKTVKKLKNGRLAAHKERSWSYENCSQEPHPSTNRSSAAVAQ